MIATNIDPDRYEAVLFDMDGVITDTASVHSAAWRRLFDDFLAGRAERQGENHRLFSDEDYAGYVDGKPRLDGVVDFLLSRGIELPRGSPFDEAGRETAHGMGKLKDRYFREAVAEHGVRVLGGAVALLKALRRHHVRTAVISASRNCRPVLESAGVAELFDARVDGVLAESLQLPGKPDPATFLEAARTLRVTPSRSIVVEDSRAGIEAARRGHFALVVGVCRDGNPEPLVHAGAHRVVTDLSDLTVSRSPDPDPPDICFPARTRATPRPPR